MSFIFNLFEKYGLFTIFIITLLEYACFPVPSEVVLPFLGYLVGRSNYELIGVIMMSVIMGYLGSLICYLIGYYGGSKIYNKIYNRFPSWRKGLETTHSFFNKYGNLSVIVGRIIPMCRTYVSFFAGIFKQGLFKYSVYSMVGITIWNTILIFMGNYFANNLNVVEKYYSKYRLFVILLIASVLGVFLIYKLYKKKKTTKNINGD